MLANELEDADHLRLSETFDAAFFERVLDVETSDCT